MSRKNFTQFELRFPVLTSDYVVGYKGDGSTEIRTQIKDIVGTVQSGIAQQLSFNEETKELSISLGGNTVSLSSLSDTEFSALSSSLFNDLTATYLPISIYKSASGGWEDSATFVKANSAVWSSGGTFSNEIRSLTGNWESTYTIVKANSSSWLTQSSSQSGTIVGDLNVTNNLTVGKTITGENIIVGNIQLTQADLDQGNSITKSVSTLYVNLNNKIYAVPLHNLPIVPASGEDVASNVAYSSLTYDTGFNGGFGFDPWVVDIVPGSGFVAPYINSSTGEGFANIDTVGVAFGMFAGPPGSDSFISAIRPLKTSLTVENALSAAIAIGTQSGDKGIILYDRNNNELYKFSASNNAYRVNNNDLNWTNTGAQTLFHLVVVQTKSNKAVARVTHKNTSTTVETEINGVVGKIGFYIKDTDLNANEGLRFNSLKLYSIQGANLNWTEEGLDISSLTDYLSTNHVTISSATILQDLIIYGNLSAVNTQNIDLTSYNVTELTTTSALEVSGTLNVFGSILSSNTNISDIFVTNASFNQVSGSFVTDTELTQTLQPYVKSTSTLETPTTGISAINNIVALSQATYDALTVKLPTTLYIIV